LRLTGADLGAEELLSVGFATLILLRAVDLVLEQSARSRRLRGTGTGTSDEPLASSIVEHRSVNHEKGIQMTAAHPGNTPRTSTEFGTPVHKANVVPVNDADNLLHLGLAVAMIALGAALGRRRDYTGQPVGTGGRAQSDTPNSPLR
jgi:hypothetical protein